MKTLGYIFTLLFTVQLIGQQPEKVYSIVKERREISWYETQVDLWEKETKKNKKNADAWYNYYSAVRALRNLSPWNSDERDAYHEQAQKIADAAYKAIPNTFEGNHLIWWQSGNDPEKLEYLFKAYEIDPLDKRSYSDLLTHYAITRDIAKYEVFCEKFFKANEIPSSIYNWAYNLLAELDENAIVLTHGDNDTYSAWVLQVVKSFRKDVHVINTSLILVDNYREKLFKEIGLDPFEKKKDDIKSHEAFNQFKTELFEHIFKNTKSVPVYISGTAISQFQDDYGDQLFLTGLAYKYCENSFDNMALIRRNYEKRYLLDYLTIYFSFNMADNIAHNFNATYLPAFVKLYKHYQEGEEYEKLKILEQYLIDISKKAGRETEVNEILGAVETVPNIFNQVLLNTKELEKQFAELKPSVYMNKYEVSNSEYGKFIKYLRAVNNASLYEMCIYDSSAWVRNFPGGFIVPMKNLYHSHPAYYNYPVLNVSHFAAEQYCEWLTEQYNKQSKRKYKAVKFRLPTEKEWMLAAGDGMPDALTYFENDQVKTDKGNYLANLKVNDKRFFDDGGFFSVAVDSYKPNKGGYYNMIGNVSEMVGEQPNC